MESEKTRVLIKLNGEQISFLVPRHEEPYFRDANEILNSRLAALAREHSAFANPAKILSVLAVEALVDALKINENYQSLKNEVQGRLENIQNRFEN
ncbi:MAG: cell division protein ZapA [Cytophagaceae bacterium]|nr:cell division protein ZapA [Cytophagaceae bacterium]MBK9510649.1 cell division protein ZapA [Cytophagaceae bacterium]MBK9934344.1 cell division protein ZapA [Cytophagaceae bacterium]MBL0300792.1 cell division protein ZapA [Cytophagaceae bacterium]MBL0327735.1 cell division protein ZapA [Cytophagaceae bacterium]